MSYSVKIYLLFHESCILFRIDCVYKYCRSSDQGRRPYLLEELAQEREALRTVEGKVGRVLGPSPASPVKLPFLSVYMLAFHGRFYLETSFQGD